MAQKLPVDLREQAKALADEWMRQRKEMRDVSPLEYRSLLLGMNSRLKERSGAINTTPGRKLPDTIKALDRAAFVEGKCIADLVVLRGGKGRKDPSPSTSDDPRALTPEENAILRQAYVRLRIEQAISCSKRG
jgi:hypothetical protein